MLRHKRARRRGQALVEFGLVVTLFVLLLSGIFDFGMLINTRLGVSSMSRELARAAAAGATHQQLDTLATQQDRIIGVTTDPFGGKYYSSTATPAAVQMTESVYDSDFKPLNPPPATLLPGDYVQIEVVARGAEVITPWMRPILQCTDAGQGHCLLPKNGMTSASTTMRVEP